jgi:hypothetical protein
MLASVLTSTAAVKVLRAPEGGIQPQAAVDQKGVAHLIYLKGDPKAGELWYTRLEDGDKFAPAIEVAPAEKGAMAIGNIRGAQIAVGKSGRVHVAWMGGGKIMYYTRLNDAGNAFETPRNLVTWAGGLDGGGTVAADWKGNVFVAWNGSAPDNKAGEMGRAIFSARSTDEGKTFSREERLTGTNIGVCACCGMRGHADSTGRVYFLYRAADGASRDMTLLESSDTGKSFKAETVSKWPVNTCPMSSSSMSEVSDGILAATESKGRVAFAHVFADSLTISDTIGAPPTGKQKHPVVAVNDNGETLLAWTENMGWAKGGSLAWQVYDRNRKPIGMKGTAAGVPVWSLITGFARPGGDFVIVY